MPEAGSDRKGRIRGLWLRARRRAAAGGLRLFRLKESRERIARGFALGLVVNFLPSFGFGVLISGFVARVLGGNLLAGIVGGASLTFVWPVLFYLNMKVGTLFVKSQRVIEDLDDVTEEAVGALVWGKAFMVGSVVNILVAGLLVYVLMLMAYQPMRGPAMKSLRRWARMLSLKKRTGAA